MSRQVYVNLPVEDLDRAVKFFTSLGFEFDPQFTDENATCMIVNDNAFVMLLTRSFFETFTPKATCDTATHNEVIVAVSAGSREEVDEIVDKALAAGGRPSKEPVEQGPMYVRSFQDVDGHLWEVLHMDLSAASG